ncbi:threonine synthase [Fibrella forsythiae]|uniref:Threonine synthase n=1 Tax=Fibrella forsythiae TaxID=2817061 RepID=A0ABS3JJL5_9BACT|nr:threonine synthase [Fibrella forsythiae]MBO0950197.1 threonine synthase [Fibrella forsythiae]
MTFYSTNNSANVVSLQEALFNSLPQDKGLYMPTSIPQLPDGFIDGITNQSLAEIAYKLTKLWLHDDLTPAQIEELVTYAFPFDTPLVELEAGRKYVLELFHGPSLAFKDVGARFMAGLMSIYSATQSREVHILVATSGDTGGAVAMGFHNVPGVRVSILYPKGRVSQLQEKQLTTLGGNIHAFEVDGSFDDCQAMVKAAFLDNDLTKAFSLSSANSINIFRLIPQSFYYFRALAQLQADHAPAVFSTPSGNFGNLSAGVLAWRMGLPVQAFVAATNLNKVVPDYLSSGQYAPMASLATLSNAMDVGNPSNFVRLQRLFEEDFDQLSSLVSGVYFTDDQTVDEMIKLRDRYNYIACPHTAVGLLGLESYQQLHVDNCGIALATAHPAKFSPVVDTIFGHSVDVPERLAVLAQREKHAIAIPGTFAAFKESLLELA